MINAVKELDVWRHDQLQRDGKWRTDAIHRLLGMMDFRNPLLALHPTCPSKTAADEYERLVEIGVECLADAPNPAAARRLYEYVRDAFESFFFTAGRIRARVPEDLAAAVRRALDKAASVLCTDRINRRKRWRKS